MNKNTGPRHNPAASAPVSAPLLPIFNRFVARIGRGHLRTARRRAIGGTGTTGGGQPSEPGGRGLPRRANAAGRLHRQGRPDAQPIPPRSGALGGLHT